MSSDFQAGSRIRKSKGPGAFAGRAAKFAGPIDRPRAWWLVLVLRRQQQRPGGGGQMETRPKK
jgi:hypothetical protein